MKRSSAREAFESLGLPGDPPRRRRRKVTLEAPAVTSEVTHNPVYITPPVITDSPMAPDISPAVENVAEKADLEEMVTKVRFDEPIPITGNKDMPSIQPTYCSEHTVEIGCNVNWGFGWTDLQRQLENRQVELKGREGRLEFRGQSFYLLRPQHGNGRGPQYKYLLMFENIKLRLTSYKVGIKGRENVQILIDGAACLTWTLEQAYQKALEVITLLGGNVLSEVMSRIDIRLDLPGQSMQPFEQAFDARHYVGHFQTRNKQESRHTTLYLGQRPLQLSIYDKIGEVEDKDNAYTRNEIYILEREWGFLPATATRVEFRLWRPALRDRGINTTLDYLAKRADLVHYLTHKAIRFTNGPVDYRNTTRASILPLWQVVQYGLQKWAGDPRQQPLKALPRPIGDQSHSVKIAVGLLLGVAFASGIPFEQQPLLEFCQKQLAEVLSKADLEQALLKRQINYGLPVQPAQSDPPDVSDMSGVVLS